jgi:hypothetical protein
MDIKGKATMKAFLDSMRPFITTVAIMFAFLGALKGVAEMFPSIMPLTVKSGLRATDLAIIGAALALAAGGR